MSVLDITKGGGSQILLKSAGKKMALTRQYKARYYQNLKRNKNGFQH
jgi:hypothetical protein